MSWVGRSVQLRRRRCPGLRGRWASRPGGGACQSPLPAKPAGRTGWRPVWGERGAWGPGWGRAAPSLRAGPHGHHYQAVLETRHHPMLPSKMAMAAPGWVWGPPGPGSGGGSVDAEARRSLRGGRMPEATVPGRPVCGASACRRPGGCTRKFRVTSLPSGATSRSLGWAPEGGQASCPQEAGRPRGQWQSTGQFQATVCLRAVGLLWLDHWPVPRHCPKAVSTQPLLRSPRASAAPKADGTWVLLPRASQQARCPQGPPPLAALPHRLGHRWGSLPTPLLRGPWGSGQRWP